MRFSNFVFLTLCLVSWIALSMTPEDSLPGAKELFDAEKTNKLSIEMDKLLTDINWHLVRELMVTGADPTVKNSSKMPVIQALLLYCPREFASIVEKNPQLVTFRSTASFGVDDLLMSTMHFGRKNAFDLLRNHPKFTLPTSEESQFHYLLAAVDNPDAEIHYIKILLSLDDIKPEPIKMVLKKVREFISNREMNKRTAIDEEHSKYLKECEKLIMASKSK